MEPAGIYLHIPYCVRKCAYCDFVSFPEPGGMPEPYVGALLREIRLVAEQTPKRRYASVFFGGGTPSLLSGEQLRRILETLGEAFDILPDAEISMECNPGTATEKTLCAYRAAGVNRLSVGLQSADDALLARIGRIHDYAAFCRTAAWAKRAGFENFNVDVMHGLPGQTAAQYLDTIRRAAESGATHVSAYGLILEEGTPLYRAVLAGRETLPDEDAVADMQDAGIALLEKLGFARYEISNFARNGYMCRHNLNYWRNGEYLGFGIAAHGCLRLDGKWTRFSNTESLRTYDAKLQKGCLPRNETLRLPPIEEMFETVMLGLRTLSGVSLREFFRRFDVRLEEIYAEPVAQLRRAEWLNETAYSSGFLALNGKGLDLQNAALQFFLS